ncbi:MAG TPA: condensation domain-containing protein, partial [Methanocorpusculum sp.]|nr:condensation domain-containing protein [Methanocorpusculum sp.]
RKDWMVKINGQRVETLEIEQVLLSVNHIKDAAVKAFSDADSQNYLAGYYVSDAEISSDDIRICLAEKLPAYMIPRYLVQLDAIPKNQNGKVDHKALLPPDISLYKTVYVSPSTPEEKALCKAFETILGCEKVGIHDDFFSLGGDSIKVMKLLSDAPVEGLTVDAVVKGKTPEAIVYLCSSAPAADSAAVSERLDTYPLTQTQKETAANCMRDTNAAMYNNPALYKFGRQTDVEKLKSAIITAVNAHPYIKATLSPDESGELRAKRNDDDTVCVSVILCDTLPELSTFVRPFTLIQSPLYRIEIYSSNDGIYLFMDFHHIICDGTSIIILFNDITKAYLDENIAAESYTGFDAALTEEKVRAGTKYQQDKQYYTNLLDGCDTDSTINPDTVSENEKLGIAEHTCTADFEKVETFCSKHNISANAFFNAVFSLVLSKYTNSTEVLYAAIYNGRNDPHLSRTFTMQIKAFPVFCQIHKDEPFVKFAGKIQTCLLNGMAHDSYSFAECINTYRLNVENYFIYQSDLLNITEFAGEEITQVPLHPDAAKSALQVYLSVVDKKLQLLAEFRTNTYSEFLIRGFLTSFDAAVKECLSVNSLSEISLITPEAARTL